MGFAWWGRGVSVETRTAPSHGNDVQLELTDVSRKSKTYSVTVVALFTTTCFKKGVGVPKFFQLAVTTI